jgi:CubicO group peptidase (beta-lactamase class C family)
MRQAVAALLLAALQVHGLPQTRALPTTNEQRFAAFGDYLESLRMQAGIPGMAAGIVGATDLAWERGFGQQDVERGIAARTDTPFQFDGLTQAFTATLVLRCVEEGRLSLEDRVGQFVADSPDAAATIRQLLTHTSSDGADLTFLYRPERLAPLQVAVRRCTGSSFREEVSTLLERLAMVNSVPGMDVVTLVPPAEGIPDERTVLRYQAALERLAKPYIVNGRSRPTPSQYVTTTLTPGSGLVSAVRDYAEFDLALRSGLLIRPDTLLAAWRAPVSRNGQPLPHGLGWFVQVYNGELIVWQIGESDNASSSMLITVPTRGFSLILVANSDALVKPFALTRGDVTVSPFGRLFLATFVK